MLHVLTGDDDFTIRQSLQQIKNGIGDYSALITNTSVLDGRQVTVEQLKNACDTVPFLADKRLVIVEGLLARFEPRGRAGRRKSERIGDKQEEYKAFAGILKQPPIFTELVLIDGRVNPGNPLLRELLPTKRIKTFPLLKGLKLQQWVERRVKAGGSDISPEAVRLMVKFVGSDLWTMANEVDKLTLYALGRRIEEADVKTVVGHAREAGVFNMVDAIIESRVGAAQELYQQLLGQGSSPAHLLVMLGRQVRIIYQIKDMRARRLTRNEIKNKLGLTSDFVLDRAWQQADRYSPSRLREVYHKLLEADLSIKTGKYGAELALNILIAELAQPGVRQGPGA